MNKKYRVHEIARLNYSDIGEYIDEDHTDRPLRNDILVDLLNEQDKKIKDKNQQLENVKHVLNYHKKVISHLEIGLCTTEKLRLIEEILNELGWDSE